VTIQGRQGENLADYVFTALSARMIGDGVPYPDVIALREAIVEWDAWFERWVGIARAYEQEARAAEAAGLQATAAESWFRSAITWHYAQFMWFHRPEEREHGERQKERVYRRVSALLDPPAERVEIPFEGTVIPGYLRLPRHSELRPACVVLLGGLESTKEEGRLFEELCLRRGVATFAFDGPGQGEYFFSQPMVRDFERYTTAVADYLTRRAEIDAERLAIAGRSLGGHYAIRAAAFDDRWRAVVDWGGPFDLDYFDDMPTLTQRGFRYVTGITNPREAERFAREAVDLTGIAERVRIPIYVQHGGLDAVIPVTQARRLIEHATNAPTTVAIDPSAAHCGHNIFHRVRPAIADWLAQRLSATRSLAGSG
jgi:2,6-dihydroxypseudooxynicotine hydrolase